MQTTKLTLEHLSVYLPYGLMCKTKDGLLELTSIQTKGRFKYWFDTLKTNTYYNDKMMGLISKSFLGSQIKPILKPLTTEIEAPQYIRDEIGYLHNKRMLIGAISFDTLQYMAKNHLDMFGLINKDLAINYFDTI